MALAHGGQPQQRLGRDADDGQVGGEGTARHPVDLLLAGPHHLGDGPVVSAGSGHRSGGVSAHSHTTDGVGSSRVRHGNAATGAPAHPWALHRFPFMVTAPKYRSGGTAVTASGA